MEHVIAFRKLGPTPEEFEAYAKYKGDKSLLSSIDQFLMKLMDIPNFKERLDLLLWVYEFPAQFEELKPEVELALAACKEMDKSKKLEGAMHYVLSIGLCCWQ